MLTSPYQNKQFCISYKYAKIVKKDILASMAKRSTGVGKSKTSRSKKTKKRLAAKREMLAQKAAKRRKK